MRWLAALACLLLPFTAQAESVVVDRVIAVVGNTPITASQVELEQELVARLPSDGCEVVFGRLLCEDAAPLERLIFRELLRQGGLAGGVEVSPVVARERWEAFVAGFARRDGVADFMERWGLDEEQIQERMGELARLDQAIDVAVGRLVRDLSEQDARRYHAQHQDTVFAGKPYEEVAAVVNRRYYLLVFERTYDSWASELRAAGRVRYVGR